MTSSIASTRVAAMSGDAPGVAPSVIVPPSLHWLGTPADGYRDDDWAVLFDCECGHWPCGGTLVRIEVTDRAVEWLAFSGPGGDDTFEGAGPFHFERQQYEAELRALDT